MGRQVLVSRRMREATQATDNGLICYELRCNKWRKHEGNSSTM